MAALAEPEQEAAIAGITPFLEAERKAGRTRIIAGQTYLEQKRWELLKAEPDKPAGPVSYTPCSPEGRALLALYRIGRIEDLFYSTVQRKGTVWWKGEITPQIAALAEASPEAAWATLSHQQAGAWDALLRKIIPSARRRPLAAGDAAPWPWPPRVDGTLSPDEAASESDSAAPPPASEASGNHECASESGRG